MNYLKGLVRDSKLANELYKCLENRGSTVHLNQVVGGAFSLYAAATIERMGGLHIFLMEDIEAYGLESDEDFYNFLLSAYRCMHANLADDGSIYVWHADTEGLNFRRAFKDAGFYLSGCCIWKKNSLPVPSMLPPRSRN